MNVKNYLKFKSIFCLKNCLDMRYTHAFMGESSTIGYRGAGFFSSNYRFKFPINELNLEVRQGETIFLTPHPTPVPRQCGCIYSTFCCTANVKQKV